MNTIEKIMGLSHSKVWTVLPDATVFEAIKIMNEKSVGALPVVENEKLICNECRLKYDIKDGIPIMLIDEAEQF